MAKRLVHQEPYICGSCRDAGWCCGVRFRYSDGSEFVERWSDNYDECGHTADRDWVREACRALNLQMNAGDVPE